MAEGFVVRRGFIESPSGRYELIADVNVTSNTTQIDFDNLNVTKEDELRLVYTLVGIGTSGFVEYFLRANDISNNYVRQQLFGNGTSLVRNRSNDNRTVVANANERSSGFIDIKISNNNRFVYQSQWVWKIGVQSNGLYNVNYNIINTSTITNITKLSVVASTANGIAVGSRLQLYKVVK